jgi:hypothetical protein
MTGQHGQETGGIHPERKSIVHLSLLVIETAWEILSTDLSSKEINLN